jgi:hypothetical protein
MIRCHETGMGNHSTTLAWRVDWRQASSLAARLIAFLVERGIVEAMPTDSGVTRLAHRPGPNANEAAISPPADPSGTKHYADFRELSTNGVEIEYRPRPRLVSGGGDEMFAFRCPSCETESDVDETMELVDKLDDPFQPEPEAKCRACGASLKVSDLRVTNGVFANLILCFWNWWPLRDSFLETIGAVVGSRPEVLYDKN